MQSFDGEFPLDPGICYLNHAGIAPWPRRTVEAVKAFAEENLRRGAVDYPRWLEIESGLRRQLRELINAPSADDIALLKNTSEALSFVAGGLPWRPGDNIVSSDEEFPSNRIVWEALATQGVVLRQVALRASDRGPEDALLASCDERTRMIAVSSAEYGSGLRFDLERIGAFCHANQILFCVDAIQTLGALPLDVQTCHADFVMADAHKWLLGPEGIALFYVNPALRGDLKLSEYGWRMVEDRDDFERRDWEPARSARRFECGSPNMLGIHAFSASLSLLLEVGIGSISRMVINNSVYLYEYIDNNAKLSANAPVSREHLCGIVSFTHRSASNAALFKHLRQRGVICALRGGAVRFSPHFYTPRERLDHALRIVDSF